MKVLTEVTLVLTEQEARDAARELHQLETRGQLDGRMLRRLYDALADRGLGPGMQTRSYEN